MQEDFQKIEIERRGIIDMKKFMKGCAWTALILIVLGFVLALAAGTTKGAATIRDVVHNVTGGTVNVDFTGLDGWGIFISEGAEDLKDGVMDGLEDLEDTVNYEIEDAMIFDDSFEIFSGDVKMEFAQEEITELDVEVGGCNFVVKESDDDKFYVEAEGTKKFQAYVHSGILVIKGTIKTVIGNNFSGDIVLRVPKGFTFEKADMEIGAGVMDLGDMSADKLDMEVGAGQITADTLIADTLNVAVGMGEAVIDDMQVNKLDAEVGMGNFSAKGSADEKVIVECAMGNVEMKLDGTSKDYDYSIECGMGNVTIGGNTYSGLANEKNINNGADRKMDVECAVGNIDIRFSED